ncbi:MAG: hypothetical protein AAF493_20890 [Pseudomonadota bacterium]
MTSKSATLGIAAVALGALVVGFVLVGGDNAPLEGEIRRMAIDAAIAEVGQGEITGAEVGNDGTAYEVEIIPAGSTNELEVRLDTEFKVVEVVPDD